MLYLANWLTIALRSIALEHSCVAVYLLVVTLAFLIVPSFWSRKKNQPIKGVSHSSTTVKLQRYLNHQKTSPGIITLRHQQSIQSDLCEHDNPSPRYSASQNSPARLQSIAEFNFTEIREKFQKMAEVKDFEDFALSFPDPPPPILTDEDLQLDKLKNGIDDPSIGKG